MKINSLVENHRLAGSCGWPQCGYQRAEFVARWRSARGLRLAWLGRSWRLARPSALWARGAADSTREQVANGCGRRTSWGVVATSRAVLGGANPGAQGR